MRRVKRIALQRGAKGGMHVAKDLTISYLLDFYGEVLTEKQRTVMEQYYNEDLSLAEIAENFGITRQGVRDAIKRGEATVRELEDKVGFAARYRAMGENLERLDQLARDIRFYNAQQYDQSPEVARAAREMLELIKQMREA